MEKSSPTFAILRKRHIIAACVTVSGPQRVRPPATDTSRQTAGAQGPEAPPPPGPPGARRSPSPDFLVGLAWHLRQTVPRRAATKRGSHWPYSRSPAPAEGSRGAGGSEARATQGPCCPQRDEGPAQLQGDVLDIGRMAEDGQTWPAHCTETEGQPPTPSLPHTQLTTGLRAATRGSSSCCFPSDKAPASLWGLRAEDQTDPQTLSSCTRGGARPGAWPRIIARWHPAFSAERPRPGNHHGAP